MSDEEAGVVTVERVDPSQVVDPTQPRRCKAHGRTSGKPCGAYAMAGQDVCRMHGGNAPQNLEAARRRLAANADPAARVLVEEMSTGDRSFDRIKAASAVLDRAGVGRSTGQVADALAAKEAEMLQVVAASFRAAAETVGLPPETYERLTAEFVAQLKARQAYAAG